MKTYILKKDDRGYFVNDTRIVDEISHLKALANENTVNMLRRLSKKPAALDAIAKMLKTNKKAAALQLEKLKKARIIDEMAASSGKRTKELVYKRTANSFSFEIEDANIKLNLREKEMDEATRKFYSKFIDGGKFNGYICVGSPDPHGEYKSIARDTHYALYMSMFLGQYVELPTNFPIVLDTEVISRNLFKENLLVIGGPVTNLITRDINSYMPIKFIKEEGWGLKDKTGLHIREYEGLVTKIRNPFDKSKDIIVIAGIRNHGTFASVLGATRFAGITLRNYGSEDAWGAVVRGYDIDGDGQIDSIEIAK